MSRATRILLLAGVIACLASGSFAAVHGEQIFFVGKCWRNGNPFSECRCTFNALKELPDNYRRLAVSWAHDNRTGFAVNVMYLIVAEARRVGGNRIKGIWDTSDPRKTIQAWVSGIGTVLRWAGSGIEVTTVAMNLAAEALPVVYDASAEFVKTRSILAGHCGRDDTFIVQVNNAREEAEKIAAKTISGTIDVVTDVTSNTLAPTAGAVDQLWSWLKSWM
jgi:hypothetical protein